MQRHKDYIEVTTTENTKAWIKKSEVSAVEVITGTSRSEGYLKLYVAGYHFGVNMELEELENLLLQDS